MRERFGRQGDEARSRARDQARWLIRDHGDEAEAIIAAKLARSTNSAVDRYRYRVTQRELQRLRAVAAQQQGHSGELTLWMPSLLGLGSIGYVVARLAGRKRRRRGSPNAS